MLVDERGRPIKDSCGNPDFPVTLGIGNAKLEDVARLLRFNSQIVDEHGRSYPGGLKIGQTLNIPRPARFGGANG